MRRKSFFLWAALIASLVATGCDRFERASSAPVVNLGTRSDAGAGAMVVGEGDALWSIAQRYRLPIRGIIDLNDLNPPYPLAQGQRLKLPPPLEYRVREGDTLYSVASMFEAGVSQLVQVNRLQEPYRISPGQNLRIPSPYGQQKIAAQPRTRQEKKEIKVIAKGTVVLPPVRPAALTRPRPVVVSSSKRPNFVWPVRGKVISAYGAKTGGLYNDGINIAVPRGTPVVAAAEGVVAYVGNDLKGYGNLVLVRHGGGMMTAYAHLAAIKVKKGAFIRKGQVLGTAGSTGTVAASQLHFEIRQGAKTYDPKRYLG